jgi:hypothetical protein
MNSQLAPAREAAHRGVTAAEAEGGLDDADGNAKTELTADAEELVVGEESDAKARTDGDEHQLHAEAGAGVATARLAVDEARRHGSLAGIAIDGERLEPDVLEATLGFDVKPRQASLRILLFGLLQLLIGVARGIGLGPVGIDRWRRAETARRRSGLRRRCGERRGLDRRARVGRLPGLNRLRWNGLSRGDRLGAAAGGRRLARRWRTTGRRRLRLALRGSGDAERAGDGECEQRSNPSHEATSSHEP